MGAISEKLVYLNGTKQAIKQAINEDFEVIDNNTTFREYADEISSNNAKYKDLIPKETKNATNTLDISNSSGLDKALVTQYGNTYQEGEPTPDTPQEIVNISGKSNVKVIGKNLFDNSVERKNAYPNITFSSIGQPVEYNNSSATYSYVNSAHLKAGQEYTISWAQSTTPVSVNERIGVIVDENNIVLQTQITWINSTDTIKFTSNYNGYLILATDINATNIQIEKGSTATTYEAYKGGSYEINLGKNLLDLQSSIIKSLNTSGTWNENVYTHNGLTITINDDKTIKINGTATAQETFLLENQQIKYPTGTYYLSGSINGGNNSYDIRMFNYDGTRAVAQCYTGVKEINVINNKQVYNVAIVVRSGQTLNNVVFYPMFSTSNDTNYSPYFTPIELCKIGDYKDRIYPLNGKWYLEKKIGKVVLDGSENWSASSTQTTGYYRFSNASLQGVILPPSSNDEALLAYFNTFETISANNTYRRHNGISCRASGNYIDVYYDQLAEGTAEDFKTWLSTNNVIVYYVLATPTTTEITESNYPTLYNQLNNIKLFEGVNHITMTNESGLDVEFDITYYKDWKLD